MRILLVEDEKYLAQALEQVLQKNNYAVDLAYDGEYGLDCALSGIYDVIVLDIMLPKMNGLEVLKSLRNERNSTPVLLLTAKSETQDKVKGLDLGADDYLAKPFKTEELLARLRALSRRKETIVFNNALAYNDIELNTNSLVLYCGTREFKLTLKESQILELLIRMEDMFVSKDSIIEKVWGFDGEAGDSHVEVYISFLRKKLKALKSTTAIKTVRGVGYSLQKESGET
ncbi:two component transcriptional regulator winged helix family [Clostridium sp. CAG:1013]|nr:two component transcriptional regulator winged helix family [Clostridium sp. CAG:1013]